MSSQSRVSDRRRPAALRGKGGCSVERMEGLLIGFVWLVVIVGGGIATAAIVQLIKAPYRNR